MGPPAAAQRGGNTQDLFRRKTCSVIQSKAGEAYAAYLLLSGHEKRCAIVAKW